jgi:MFS family permease
MIQDRERISPLGRVRRVYYGWWLVGVAALVMALGSVPVFQGMPVWSRVMEGYFGWSRTQLSLAFTLTFMEVSLIGPLAGFLIQRLGPRQVMLIGLMFMGGGFLLFGQVQNLPMFYLAFGLVSIGSGLGSWLTMMTVLNSWFIRKRSTAMAMAMEGSALGGIVLVPALAWVIDPENFGPERWRTVAMGIGIALLAIAFPITRLVRRRPEDYGLLPDGDPPTPARAARSQDRSARQATQGQEGYTWQQAIRTRIFWFMTMGHACSSIVTVTIMVHLGLMLGDRDISLQTVGFVVSTYAGVTAIFTLVGGYVGDRVPIRLALFVFSGFQCIGIAVLLLANNTGLVFLFAVIVGMGFGGRTPLTTSVRGVYFGRRAFAIITGISMIPMNFLLVGMPLFVAWRVDATGSYTFPFIVVTAVCALGSCLFLLLGDPNPVPPQPASGVAPSPQAGDQRVDPQGQVSEMPPS